MNPSTRTKHDDCLLCRRNKATATNSHIYTKWITESMFGDKHNKQGGRLDTGQFDYGSKTSDTAKENHILCPECENGRLGRNLETYVATFFYQRYRNPKYTEKFPLEKRFNWLTQEIDCVVCDPATLHPIMFKLYIYSLVWRASISNHPTYKNFKLPEDVEEKLRYALDTFLQGDDANATIAYYEAHKEDFPHFQYNIITSIDQTDATANLVTEPLNSSDGVYLMYVNEFIIVFYTKWDGSRKFDRAFNPGLHPVNLGQIEESEWKGFVKSAMEMAVDNYVARHKNTLATRKPQPRWNK